MSKAQYDIYLGKVMDLAKTLVVKSQATAEAINQGLQALGLTVYESDPTSWKYYLNLTGQYHSTDRLMTVISLDTLQTIDFTKENLQDHLATYREYTYNSRYYNELVGRYPDQEMLIRGILNPVNLTKAINAVDGEILWYDPELIEDNETNVIPQLEEWCKGYMVRWNVKAYTITDDLYAASQLAILYLNLPITIMNIRLANCHTRYAHTFHIREYLASNGRLDKYVDNMTKKQMLWLYRNIRYIHRNAGKQETFQWLLQNILTDRGLPLAEWNMRHNLRDQLDEIYPDVEFVRNALNFGYSSAGADTRDVTEMLVAERPVAKGNERVEDAVIPIITELMENSLSNRLSTKVLESSVLDLTDAAPFTLSDCLLNHWLYLACTERYKAVIVVDNPKTGGSYTFTMKDAFTVFLYAYNKARGLTLETIPELEAIFVRRIPMPGKPELRGIVDADLIGEDLIDAAYTNIPIVGTYISTVAFRNAAVAIHKGQLWHRELYATREHYIQRGLMEQMTGRFYCDYPCTLEEDVTNYDQWFQDRGLDVPTFSELEADLLAIQILSFATGANLKVSQSLKDMQGAMLRMMAQLSSYSVQYLQSINTDPIKVIDWPVIRVGDADVHGADHVYVDAIDTRVEDISARGHTLVDLPLDLLGVVWNYDIRMHASGSLDINLDWNMVGKITVRDKLDIRPIDIINVVEPLDILGDDTPDVITDEYVPGNLAPLNGAFVGFQSPHYSLTQLELDEIQARWAAWVLIHGEPSLPLANVIPNDDLDGIDYPELALINDTILDGFDPPIALDIGTVDLPGIGYPELVVLDEDVLDGFDPPDAVDIDDVDLPGIDYPTLVDITTPTLGGLVDPSEDINNLNMGGLNYPP